MLHKAYVYLDSFSQQSQYETASCNSFDKYSIRSLFKKEIFSKRCASNIQTNEKLRKKCIDDDVYISWVPLTYSIGQLKSDALNYYNKTASYSMNLVGVVECLPDNLSIDELLAKSSDLQFCLRTSLKETLHMPLILNDNGNKENLNCGPDNELYIHEHLFDIFLFYALQTSRVGTPLRISCYHFKTLVKKATANHPIHKKSRLAFDTHIQLAFQSAIESSHASFGATFGNYLQALSNVAENLFPQEITHDKAFRKLTNFYMIPYLEEAKIRYSQWRRMCSWDELDALLEQAQVQSVLLKFAQPLEALALTYSSTHVFSATSARLHFNDVCRLVHELKPPSLVLDSTEMGRIFLHCSRSAQERALAIGQRNLTAFDLPCTEIVTLFGYLSLILTPRLVQSISWHNVNWMLNTSLAVLSLKAFAHNISIQLSDDRQGLVAKKQARYASARVSFLQTFSKMHRADGLCDYTSEYFRILTDASPTTTEETVKLQEVYHESNRGHFRNILGESDNQEQIDIASSRDELDTHLNVDPAQINCEDGVAEIFDSDLEVDWSQMASNKKTVGHGQDLPAESDYVENIARLKYTDTSIRSNQSVTNDIARISEENIELMLEADEIYCILVTEILRYLSKPKNDIQETLPAIREIWLAAGQKYNRALQELTDYPISLAKILYQSSVSLYGFAIQLLKNGSHIFTYEKYYPWVNNIFNCNSIVPYSSSNIQNMHNVVVEFAEESLSIADEKLLQSSKALSEILQDSKSHNNYGKQLDDIKSQYITCLKMIATCFIAHGDILAYNSVYETKHEHISSLETELGEFLNDIQENATIMTTTLNYNIDIPKLRDIKIWDGLHFWIAMKIYLFVIKHSISNINRLAPLYIALAESSFKLCTQLPNDCAAKKKAWNISECCIERSLKNSTTQLHMKKLQVMQEYMKAKVFIRQKYFPINVLQNDSTKVANEPTNSPNQPVESFRKLTNRIFHKLDKSECGLLKHEQLDLLNKICTREVSSNDDIMWLLSSFEARDEGLTEKGFTDYLSWLVGADPISFCEIVQYFEEKQENVARNFQSYPRIETSLLA